MSIVGFKSTNHPQQVKVRGASDAVDERITPDELYQAYHERFHFTLDVAANASNAKTDKFYSREQDGLRQPWAPERVWANIPYSNCAAWLFKAHREFEAGCPVIVMLLPANRSEQKWWQQFIEPFRDCGSFLKTEFIPRRRNFGVPGNEGAVYPSGVPFGLVAVIFDARPTPLSHCEPVEACSDVGKPNEKT